MQQRDSQEVIMEFLGQKAQSGISERLQSQPIASYLEEYVSPLRKCE